MPEGTPLERTARVLRELGAYIAHGAGGHRLPGLCRHGRADQLQRPRAPVLPAQRAARRRPAGEPGRQAPARRAEPRDRAGGCGPRSQRSARATARTLKVVEVPPGPAGARAARRRDLRAGSEAAAGGRTRCARVFERNAGHRRRRRQQHRASAARRSLAVDRQQGGAARRAAAGDRRARCAPAWPARPTRPTCTTRASTRCRCTLRAAARAPGRPRRAAAARGARARRHGWCRSRELVTRERHASASSRSTTRTCCRWSTSPATWPAGSTARCTACSACVAHCRRSRTPGGAPLEQRFISQPDDP